MSSMIVCPEPPAAKVGQEIFAAGGNAVDAGVAAAFAQGVSNPFLCGLGGTAIMHLYDGRKRQSLVLNCRVACGSRPVPDHWAQEYLGRAETIGRYILKSEANQVGYQSVMVPGFVRNCWDAYQRFGSRRLSWAELLAPSVQLARDGFEVYPYIAAYWQDKEDRPGYPGLAKKLQATPDAARYYLKPDGSIYRLGDWFKQPAMADTLQRLADAGGEDFYSGEIAQMIARDFEAHDGFITFEDLQSYVAWDQQPLRGRFQGLEVTTTPLPSNGPQILEMLHILEHFDLSNLAHNSPEYIDLFARLQRATFADSVPLKCADLDSPEVKAEEQKTIGQERASYWAGRIEKGDRIVVRGGAVESGTTHLTCVDKDRNIVSFTHSIGSIAGSGVITSGLGFLFNNFLGHLHPLAGQPDSIVPGKRMGGGPPTIVFKDGEPYIAIGAPEGAG